MTNQSKRNSSKNGHISQRDYLNAIKIWNAFKMKNMVEYHDNYLKRDVLLPADLFEKFLISL